MDDAAVNVYTPEESFRRSQQLLLDLDLVCFQDQMDVCLRQLRRLLHHLPVSSMEDESAPYHNKGKDREVSFKTRAMIRAVNHYDIKIFEWANATFRHD
jgi:hypothetical protein